ncbi:MAG: DUF1554 domain-containing protein [Kofleriaceae bacterium]|nr:DUF1554 domain-containing protein [Kofleriaceae bacterium]
MKALHPILIPITLLVTGCSGTDSIDHGVAADSGPADTVIVNPPSTCPHIDLGNQVPVAWDGSTVGLPNFVESSRLEWREAPDDSLVFTAPEDGLYNITLESPSGNGGFGVSVQDFEDAVMGGSGAFYTPADCPSNGQVKLIDGVYSHNSADSPLSLMAGQSILLWVSSTYWSDVEEGEYTIRINNAAAASQKKVFVSSSTSGGNLGGLAGADAQCQTLANEAGLGGTYVAWLSDADKDAVDRLTGEGPWVRVDGEQVAASKTDLVDIFSNLDNGIWLDESGNFLASDRIWTGTNAGGQYIESIGDNCSAWTSDAMGQQARIGRVGATNKDWTSASFTSCDQTGSRIICLEN